VAGECKLKLFEILLDFELKCSGVVATKWDAQTLI
jgi:hypothetical protein